jgi:phage replication O-like protein O
MSNVVRLARPEGKAGGRVADVDEGYTRLANELLDELVMADLTKHQYKVMLAVIRKTYGFNKPVDRISDSQIAEATGLLRHKVNKAKQSLLAMKLLVKTGTKIGVNKVVSDWNLTCTQNGHSVPETGTKTVPETGTGNYPKRVHTKDTIQKTKDKISSSQLADASPDPFLADHPEAAVFTPNGKAWGTADDLKAARWMFDRIKIIVPTSREPNWPDWANTVRLMREIDERTHHEICSLFDFASKDPFWCTNILSPSKLRKQWNTLEARRNKGPVPGGAHWHDENDTSWTQGDWGY